MRLSVSSFIKNEILLNLEQVCESNKTSITKAIASVMNYNSNQWQQEVKKGKGGNP